MSREGECDLMMSHQGVWQEHSVENLNKHARQYLLRGTRYAIVMRNEDRQSRPIMEALVQGLAYEYDYVDGSSNSEVARRLYEVARDGGFELVEQLLQSLSQATSLDQSQIDDRPDFSDFYRPRYLDAIYNRRFEELNADMIKVVVYLTGMYDCFKQAVNWFDLRCAHMHDTRLTQKILRDMFNSNPSGLFGNAETIFQDIIRLVMDSTGGGLGETAALALEMPVLIDEGKRDASHLITNNNDEMGFYCESDSIKRLYKNAQ